MDEAARVLARLTRIDELRGAGVRDGGAAPELLAELRALVPEAEAWARAEAMRGRRRRRRNFERGRKEWAEPTRKGLHMGLARLLPRPDVRPASATAYGAAAREETQVIAL